MGNYLFKSIRGKDVRILMMGLDAAGKTTILYRMKLGEVVTTIPTIGFNVETVTHKRMNLTAWDVGGRDKIRPLYRHYYQNTQALVHVIDSNDRESGHVHFDSGRVENPLLLVQGQVEKTRISTPLSHYRLEQSIDELVRILDEDELQGVPIVIMANKQDLPNAMTPEDIYTEIRKASLVRHRDWAVFGVSALTGDGLFECLDWLTTHIDKNEKPKDHKEQKSNSLKDANEIGHKQSKDVSKLSYFSDVIYTFGKMLMSK